LSDRPREELSAGDNRSLHCIAGGYVALSAVWIVVTDVWTEHLVAAHPGWSLHQLALLQIAKGLCFVAATGALLYALLRSLGRRTRQREHALLDERARMRIVVDSLPHPLWLKDINGVYQLCNQAALEVLGVRSPTEVLGRTAHDLLPPERAAIIHAHDLSVMQTGKTTVLEHSRWREMAGQEQRLEAVKTPIRDSNGRVNGLLGIAHDITQQTEVRRAIEERAALQARLVHVVDSVPGVVCSFTLRSNGAIDMLFVSGAVRFIYGLEPEEIISDIRIVNAFVHPDDFEGVTTTVLESARTLEPWHHTWRYHHPERGLIWLESHALPQRDADGNILWHGYLQDCTARQLAEERRVLLLDLTAEFLKSGHDEVSLAESLFKRVRGHLGATTFFNFRKGRGLGRLELVASHGLPPDTLPDWEEIDFHTGYCGVVARERTQVSADELRMRTDPQAAKLHALGLRSYVGCPLLAADGRVLGTFSIASSSRGSYDRAELDFLQTACQSLALAWQRVAGERALEASQSALLEAQSLARVGSWRYSAADAQVSWSTEMQRMMGLTDASAASLGTLLDAVHPEDRELVGRACAAAMGGRPYDLEHRLIIGGETRWVRARGLFKLDPSGHPLEGVGTLQDITERTAMLRELERHKQHLEETVSERTHQLEAANRHLSEQGLAISDLYNRAPCGYHSLDADGWIVGINDTELSWLGFSRQEVLGRKRFIDLLSIDSRPRFAIALRGLLESGQLLDVDYELVRKDGSHLPVTLSSSVVRDAEGRFLWTRSTLFDNTERRRREVEIAALNEELARRADEAEAANRAKTAFLANMSHEIRTPMNAILGFTDLLSRTCNDPADGGRLAQIGEAARHLLSSIDDVLDLSKIEAGKLTLEFTDFDFEELVRQVCALFHDKAEAKGLELRLDIDGSPAMVRGDATRLRQVLINYLSNAVKFTDRGSITIRVATTARSASAIDVKIEIEDTGIGVEVADQARLFEPFEQADGSTTRRFGGTGLGLAINRRIAALMGGQVGLRSTPGRGSCFWITVQLGIAGFYSMPETSARDLAGLEILLVDEESGSGAALAAMLESLDLRVSVLLTSEVDPVLQSALRADRNGRHFAAAVMTARSPGNVGWLAAARLRALPLRRRLPSLVLSELPAAEAAADHDGLAADSRLELPVTVAALRLALLRTVRQDPLGGTRRAAILAHEERLRSRHRGAHVLLAEDHPLNQRVACDMLQVAGLSFELAGNGEEAVALARGSRFDLVLMDVHMPLMNGLDASAAIRALPGFAHTPIIAMTADGFDEDLSRCRRAGMDDLLMKPVAAEVFYETLTRWLDAAALRNGARRLTQRASSEAPLTPAPDPMLDLVRALEALPGVDVATGMKFARGRHSVYLELLNMFADPEHLVAARLEEAAAAAKPDELRERAHALKGVAALIGATRIERLAADLEAAARSAVSTLELITAARLVDDSLEELAAAIRMLPAPRDKAAGKPGTHGDQIDAQELLDKLERALERGDFTAFELVQQHSASLQLLLGRDAPTFERHVTAFAFEAARRVLLSARYSSTA